MTININKTRKQYNTYSAIRHCLLALANGKTKCDCDYPNFRKIKVEIIGVDFSNIIWRPIHVRISEKGLKQEVTEFEEGNGFGGYDYESPQILVKKNVPFTEAWVNIHWLSNYA